MSSIATEIEALPLYQQALFAQAIKVDFHPAVLNPTAIVPVATTILRAVTDFARLPRLLREGRKLLEDEKRRNKKRGLGRVFRVLFEDSEAALLRWVRNRTGSYHYGEAERVLAAVMQEVGNGKLAESLYSPGTLRKRFERVRGTGRHGRSMVRFGT